MIRRLAAVATLLLASACGGKPAAGPSSPPPAITVFAAASLKGAFTAEAAAFAKTPGGGPVTFNFAGTPTLVTQLQSGARADVFASADLPNMVRAQALGLVKEHRQFAANALEIAVAPGNPKHIATLADLARPDVTLVLAGAAVPAGSYAAQALARAGVQAHPKSLETDVESVLGKVELGVADAGIVYSTDVRAAGSRVDGVPIPAAQNVTATYWIAPARAPVHPQQEQAFIAFVLSPAGQAVLTRAGFLPADGA